jgi:Fe-S-cluster formation regulator IscX/YfhJ
LKVLRSDIEKLPLPKLNQKQHQKIVSFVENLLDEKTSTENRKEKYTELDDYIMDLFGLKDDEKEQVMSNVKISDRLLSIE